MDEFLQLLIGLSVTSALWILEDHIDIVVCCSVLLVGFSFFFCSRYSSYIIYGEFVLWIAAFSELMIPKVGTFFGATVFNRFERRISSTDVSALHDILMTVFLSVVLYLESCCFTVLVRISNRGKSIDRPSY